MKNATIYGETLTEADLGINKTALLKPRLKRKIYKESGGKEGEVTWQGPASLVGDTEEERGITGSGILPGKRGAKATR